MFPIFNKGVSALTEKENNIKEQDNEQEQENEDLKVVMPDAEWTTMPDEEFDEQPDYLKVFTDFYIAKFNQRDLEIMNMYDVNSNMVDINHYVIDNINFGRRELIKHALQYHANNFQSIVDEIVKQDKVEPEKMTSYTDWDNWYENRRDNISTSLS